MTNTPQLNKPTTAVTHDGNIAVAGIAPGPRQDIAILLNANFDVMANIWHWTRRDSDETPPDSVKPRTALRLSCCIQLPQIADYAPYLASLNRDLAKLVTYASATEMSRVNSGVDALLPDGSIQYLTHYGLPTLANRLSLSTTPTPSQRRSHPKPPFQSPTRCRP